MSSSPTPWADCPTARSSRNIASVFILGLGIIAALNQVGIATTVTTPVLIAVLATVAGILIVGVGGGLVRPMQSRWEQYLETMSQETGRIKAQVQRAPSVADQAKAAKARYDEAGRDDVEARAADDFYHDRPAAGATRVIDDGLDSRR